MVTVAGFLTARRKEEETVKLSCNVILIILEYNTNQTFTDLLSMPDDGFCINTPISHHCYTMRPLDLPTFLDASLLNYRFKIDLSLVVS